MSTPSSPPSFQHHKKTPNSGENRAFQHQKTSDSGENRASFLSNGCLFVGGLHPSVTESDLYDLFTPVASVVSIWIRKNKGSSSYGFVHLEDSQQASNAIKLLNNTPVNGKPIKIGPSYRNRPIMRSEQANLLVNNLDASIDDKSLRDTFADFGSILFCKVAKDRNGQSKRYGFVQFDQERAAQNAIKGLNGVLIKDKQLRVCLSIHSEEKNLAIGTQKFTKVYVGNFSETTTEEDFREAFAKFGPITMANVVRDANGNSRCFGFVSFQNPDDAAIAVDKVNGVTANDGKVWLVEKAKAKGMVKRKRWLQDKLSLESYEYLREGSVNGGSLEGAIPESGRTTSAKAQNSQGPVNLVPFPSDIRRFLAVGPRLTPQLLNFGQHAYTFPCQPTYCFQQQPCPGIWPAAIPNFVTVCPQHQMVKSNANQGVVHVPNVVDTYVVPQMPFNVSGVPVLPTNAPQPGPTPLSKLPSSVAPAVLQHQQYFVQRDGNQRFIYLSNAWNMVNPLLVPPWRMSPMPLVSVTHVPPMAVPLPAPVSFSLIIAATPRIVFGKELSPFLERLKHANIGQLSNRSPRTVFFSGKTISIAYADPKRIVLNHHQSSATNFHQNRSNLPQIAKVSKEGEEEIEICAQGSIKTELCNKWEKNGSCVYGDKCRFAHGLHELRPVLRKPKFKTEMCRAVSSAGTCPYGHRCHYRHSLDPNEVVL